MVARKKKSSKKPKKGNKSREKTAQNGPAHAKIGAAESVHQSPPRNEQGIVLALVYPYTFQLAAMHENKESASICTKLWCHSLY